MTFDRRWLDEQHIGDHVGRTVWALGRLLADEPPDSTARPAAALFDRLRHQIDESSPSLRTAAYTLLGLTRLGESEPQVRHDVVARLAQQLLAAVDRHSADGWRWFEDRLTYDNARLPQAAIAAGRYLGDQRLVECGLRTLEWLGDQCSISTGLRLPGHHGRSRGESHPGGGDEQPLDATALVEAELEAFECTGDSAHARRAADAMAWFDGRNRLGKRLIDPDTGGCFDGLTATDVNRNQGAESSLAYLSARLLMERSTSY